MCSPCPPPYALPPLLTDTFPLLRPLFSRRAPEAFDPLIGGVSTAIDIFSLGVIMWECVTRTQPWEGLSNVAIIYQVGPDVIHVDKYMV